MDDPRDAHQPDDYGDHAPRLIHFAIVALCGVSSALLFTLLS
jgi:hypothetical protein